MPLESYIFVKSGKNKIHDFVFLHVSISYKLKKNISMIYQGIKTDKVYLIQKYLTKLSPLKLKENTHLHSHFLYFLI